ncbi:MAG: cell division protein FtsL [Proteobacteria bacterium]|nr:cell division protein FtsL [Pseudomonadota bacterium]
MNLLRQLTAWFMAPQPVAASLLCLVLIVSALGVAYSSHQTRNMYRELQVLEKDNDDLEHEFEKLLLEQSAWADYTRLNEVAREKLDMAPPETDDMVVLR